MESLGGIGGARVPSLQTDSVQSFQKCYLWMVINKEKCLFRTVFWGLALQLHFFIRNITEVTEMLLYLTSCHAKCLKISKGFEFTLELDSCILKTLPCVLMLHLSRGDVESIHTSVSQRNLDFNLWIHWPIVWPN